MKIVCAWCNERQKVTNTPDDGLISHTICPRCHEKLRQETRETIQKPAFEPLDTYGLLKPLS